MSEPLVLLPGLSTTPAVWRQTMRRMPATTRTLAPLLPALQTTDAIAASLLGELPERFALAGFSFGGYVALAMLAAAPQRITRLALISTGATADSEPAAGGRRRLIEQALAGDYESIHPRLTRFVLHPKHVDDESIGQARARMALDYGVERYVAHQRAALDRPDRSALLAGLRVPVLVAVGRADQVTPVAQHEAMAASIAGARLAVVEEAGHMLPLEQPQALAREIAGWIGRQPLEEQRRQT